MSPEWHENGKERKKKRERERKREKKRTLVPWWDKRENNCKCECCKWNAIDNGATLPYLLINSSQRCRGSQRRGPKCCGQLLTYDCDWEEERVVSLLPPSSSRSTLLDVMLHSLNLSVASSIFWWMALVSFVGISPLPTNTLSLSLSLPPLLLVFLLLLLLIRRFTSLSLFLFLCFHFVPDAIVPQTKWRHCSTLQSSPSFRVGRYLLRSDSIPFQWKTDQDSALMSYSSRLWLHPATEAEADGVGSGGGSSAFWLASISSIWCLNRLKSQSFAFHHLSQ